MAASFFLPSPSVHLLGAAGGRRRRKGFTVLCTSHAPPTPSGVGGGEPSRLGMFLEDGEQLKRRTEYLAQVRSQFLQVDEPAKAMATVEALQRLGIDYHFEEEVGMLLNLLHESFDDGGN